MKLRWVISSVFNCCCRWSAVIVCGCTKSVEWIDQSVESCTTDVGSQYHIIAKIPSLHQQQLAGRTSAYFSSSFFVFDWFFNSWSARCCFKIFAFKIIRTKFSMPVAKLHRFQRFSSILSDLNFSVLIDIFFSLLSSLGATWFHFTLSATKFYSCKTDIGFSQ